MFTEAATSFREELDNIKASGLYKRERIIESPQSSRITVNGKDVLNLCANNYLGLSNHPVLRESAKDGIDEYGFGVSSVRFICGTQSIHKALEREISQFLKTDDTILYSSCFDANGGLFETILGEQDAVVSDALNHASIIDGIRLCKAHRLRYEHNDLKDLRTKLEETRKLKCRRVLIATDSVFSMDGDLADLAEICSLADEFAAMVMVDESHATGFFGPTGRGVAEHFGVMNRIDITTSTLGKALGGAVGGFTTGRTEIIELLRQRSRPYLFSNSLAPAVVCASIAALSLLQSDLSLRNTLAENTDYFRSKISELGFNIRPGIHPIIPIMLGEAKLAVDFADAMLKEGIYVIGFSYPVVPKGQARIRVQISAAHTREDLAQAIMAFAKVGRALGVVNK